MATFTLEAGRRYRATLSLGWIEQFAGNDLIAAELARAGFGEVAVSGAGENRVAEGVWTRESQEVPLPEQVTELVAVA
jgi:hypothetical protein